MHRRALLVLSVTALACGGAQESAKKQAAGAAKEAPAPEKPPAPEPEPEAEPQAAAVGSPAPDFELPDQEGKPVTLAEHRDKQPVILAFYPKDFTGG